MFFFKLTSDTTLDLARNRMLVIFYTSIETLYFGFYMVMQYSSLRSRKELFYIHNMFWSLSEWMNEWMNIYWL